jgi:hypothetical protein
MRNETLWPEYHQESGHQEHEAGGYADEVDKGRLHWKLPK